MDFTVVIDFKLVGTVLDDITMTDSMKMVTTKRSAPTKVGKVLANLIPFISGIIDGIQKRSKGVDGRNDRMPIVVVVGGHRGERRKGRVLKFVVEQSLERTICENGMEKISLRREGSDIAT